MFRDWLVVGFVFAVLWLFWIWLCGVLDAISQWQDAKREERQ